MSDKITKDDLEEIKKTGLVDLDSKGSTFILKDNEATSINSNDLEGIHFLPLRAGLKRFPAMKEKLWSLINKDQDNITKDVADSEESDLNGYFILAEKGTKAVLPLQACFLVRANQTVQKVHNLIILEEDAEIHIINGCMSSDSAENAKHLGITEIFLEKGSTLSYSMIHDWNEQTEVFPKSAIYVGEDATFISNYIAFKTSKMVKTNPLARLQKNAVARFNTIIYAPENAHYEVGSRCFLEGEGARTEIISRAVSGGGTVIAPAHIKSTAPKTKGHMECSALLLQEKGRIHAIPELESYHQDVELSHEAAIGKISDDELNYLMARGLNEEEATATIVRGFLDLEIKGLPAQISKKIKETINLLEKSSI